MSTSLNGVSLQPRGYVWTFGNVPCKLGIVMQHTQFSVCIFICHPHGTENLFVKDGDNAGIQEVKECRSCG